MRAEEMFENYGRMLEERKRLVKQINNFTGVPKPEIQNDFFRKLMAQENRDYQLFLAGRYRELDDEITFFEDAVRMLGEKKSEIIFALLDGNSTWDEIADMYHISRSTVGKYRKQAIDSINSEYERRDRTDLQYLLS